MRRTPEPVGQQARWKEILEEFNFSIEHRPASKHGNADAMSRQECRVRDCACRSVDEVAKSEMREQRESLVIGEVKAAKRKEARQEVSVSEKDEDEAGRVDFVSGAADQSVGNDRPAPDIGAEQQQGDADGSGSVFVWSADGLKKEQERDRGISAIMQLMQKSQVKPPWESVALASHDAKVLWAQWPRLQIRDGLLKRKFESLDGLSTIWQIVWPSTIRSDFFAFGSW